MTPTGDSNSGSENVRPMWLGYKVWDRGGAVLATGTWSVPAQGPTDEFMESVRMRLIAAHPAATRMEVTVQRTPRVPE